MEIQKKLLLTIIPVFLFCFTVLAQTKNLKGIVHGSENDPLSGVTVQVKETNKTALTGTDGSFSIQTSGNAKTLVFSYVGMETQEVSVSGKTDFQIQLKPVAASLDEVVVVGYGTQKKATLTGAIVSLEGKKVAEAPVTNVSNGLVGRLPGLSSVQRSGEPGRDGSTILIRGINTLGNNSALIVVDGIPGRSLDRIDPNSIESITVLKDASAAIYGSEAANGVILITTKRGKVGKPQITFNLNEGYNQPTVIPKMANAWEYATMLNEIDLYAGRAPRASAEEIQKYKENNKLVQNPLY